jgi:hypothetical protein
VSARLATPTSSHHAVGVLMLNVLLGAFNMLPLPPLDGGRCSASSCPRTSAGAARPAAQRQLLDHRPAGGVAVFPYHHRPIFTTVLKTGASRLVYE